MINLDEKAVKLGYRNWRELRRKLPNVTAQRLINEIILKDL